MSKSSNTSTQSLTIIDEAYRQWIVELKQRYHQSQIRAAVKVNSEQLRFYWDLGRDLMVRQEENQYGSRFFAILSHDLKEALGNIEGLSPSTIRYAKRFYQLYSQLDTNFQQVAENFIPDLQHYLFAIPWGHHMIIIDKCSDEPQKALFYVQQTLENGWSRAMLLTWMGSDLYERQGKAISNFTKTLPAMGSDLAQEITKDPYNFSFTGIRRQYNEKQLKEALLNNITKFLVELGAGFAYVGREYRLQIGEKEKFVDLLFFHLQLNCYVVVEVKIGEFDFADMGQIGGYVAACNHLLKQPQHNPTIGLLICKDKDNLLAQYSLESSNEPIAISSFELQQLYPQQIEGEMPSLEEIEAYIRQSLKDS